MRAGPEQSVRLLAEIEPPLHTRLSPLTSPLGRSTLIISECLSVLRGVVQAGNGNAASWVCGAMFAFGSRLDLVISSYSVHADIVKLALEVFARFVETQLDYVSAAQSLEFYQLLRNAIQAYAKEVSCVPAKSWEEMKDRYKCMKVIFHTLSALSSASPPCDNQNTTQIILEGIAVMLPFLAGAQGAELLQFPKLCRLFFTTTNYVISEDPPALARSLPVTHYNTLLHALEFGVAHHDTAISRNCLEALAAIAKAHRGAPVKYAYLLSLHPFNIFISTKFCHSATTADILARFTESVLKILLYGETPVDDILGPTSEALFPLIQCVPDRYFLIKSLNTSVTSSPKVHWNSSQIACVHYVPSCTRPIITLV